MIKNMSNFQINRISRTCIAECEYGKQFDEKMHLLMANLDEYWRILNERTARAMPRSCEQLQRLAGEHKQFENDLQVNSISCDLLLLSREDCYCKTVTNKYK